MEAQFGAASIGGSKPAEILFKEDAKVVQSVAVQPVRSGRIHTTEPSGRTFETELSGLHALVIRGDPNAADEAACFLLRIFEPHFQRKYYALDFDTVHDAIMDTILAYLASPQRFTSANSRFLYRSLELRVRRNIAHSVSAVKRRKQREERWVEILTTPWLPKSTKTAESLCDSEEELNELVRRITETPEEVAFVHLLLNGEPSRQAMAQTLGVGALEVRDQLQLIKRVKDRLKARIRKRIHLLPSEKTS